MQTWCALSAALTAALAGSGTVAFTALRAGGVLTGAPPLSCARLLAEAAAPSIEHGEGRGLQGSLSSGVLAFSTVTGLDAGQIQSRLRATFDVPSNADSALAASARAACAAFNVSACPPASASVRLTFLSEPVVVAYAEDSTGNSPANAGVAGAATGAPASSSALGVGIGVGAGGVLVLALAAFLVMRRRGSFGGGSAAAAEVKQSPLGGGAVASNPHVRSHSLVVSILGAGPTAAHPATATSAGPTPVVGGAADGLFAMANPMAQVQVADHSKPTRGAAARAHFSTRNVDAA